MENLDDPWAVLEKPVTRTPRSLETRENTARQKTWVQPSLLPDPVPADGWVFKWVRASSRGNDDTVNVDKRRREGWEPVRAEDHPEILKAWNMEPRNGLIESGGLVLYKMPQEVVDQRNRHYLHQSIDAVTSAEEHYMRDNDQIIKKFKDAKVRSTFRDRPSR